MTEVRTTSSTGGEKGVKPQRYDLIPVEALATIAELYGKGAEKYAAHNWRNGYEWSKSYAALQRHANAFWRGEDIDPEMGLPHMASVAFHALTLLIFMEEQPHFDDRYSAGTLSPDQRAELVSHIQNDAALGLLREKLTGNSISPSPHHLQAPSQN